MKIFLFFTGSTDAYNNGVVITGSIQEARGSQSEIASIVPYPLLTSDKDFVDDIARQIVTKARMSSMSRPSTCPADLPNGENFRGYGGVIQPSDRPSTSGTYSKSPYSSQNKQFNQPENAISRKHPFFRSLASGGKGKGLEPTTGGQD